LDPRASHHGTWHTLSTWPKMTDLQWASRAIIGFTNLRCTVSNVWRCKAYICNASSSDTGPDTPFAAHRAFNVLRLFVGLRWARDLLEFENIGEARFTYGKRQKSAPFSAWTLLPDAMGKCTLHFANLSRTHRVTLDFEPIWRMMHMNEINPTPCRTRVAAISLQRPAAKHLQQRLDWCKPRFESLFPHSPHHCPRRLPWYQDW